MNPTTADRLLDLNRRFYAERGRDFSDTRLRVQPGVRRILESLQGTETILDLGCGNGNFARELSRRGHRGRYVGVDFSVPLLEEARKASYTFPVEFVAAELADLTNPAYNDRDTQASGSWRSTESQGIVWPTGIGKWSAVTAFAVLHHIPGRERQISLLKRIRDWIALDGNLIHSSWQLSANQRLRGRILPWMRVQIRDDEVDEGDFLVDWRRGGLAYRYVHEFSASELANLADETGFRIAESFRADGADGRSGLYQIWRPV